MIDERKMNIGGELYENYRRSPMYLEVLVYCHLMLLAKYY